MLRVECLGRLPDAARDDAHTGRAVPPDDAGEDRAVSPVDEERREARRVPHPVGAPAGDRALRRALQPPPAARVAAERDPGGHVRGAADDDLGSPRADQTRDAAPAEARESVRSLTTSTRRECLLLTSPNGPDDFDDVQSSGVVRDFLLKTSRMITASGSTR